MKVRSLFSLPSLLHGIQTLINHATSVISQHIPPHPQHCPNPPLTQDSTAPYEEMESITVEIIHARLRTRFLCALFYLIDKTAEEIKTDLST